MGIKRDVSDVPRGEVAGGNPPDPYPRYVTRLAEAWHEGYDDSMAQPANPEDRWRASEAGQCAKAVGYGIDLRDAVITLADTIVTGGKADVALAGALVDARQPSNPPSVADSWRFGLGTMVHALLEVAVTKAFPGAVAEKVVDYRRFGIPGSGRVDLCIDTITPVVDGRHRTHLELKTINGFGFKKQATNFKGFAEGPKANHLVQGALNATADDADELVIGYLSLENLSPTERDRQGVDEIGRFAAEWSYPRDVFEPLAMMEIKRVLNIIKCVDQGVAVPRMIPELPKGATVVNPRTGLWTVTEPVEVGKGAIVDSGTTWHCNYCRWQDTCAADER